MTAATTATATKPGIPDLKQSRVGKIPVQVLKGVTVTFKDGVCDVKGPKGNLSRKMPPNVDIKVDGTQIKVMPTIGGRDGARFQGLARALIGSMVQGAGLGYAKTLQLVGTGYRAELKGQVLNLSLGFSHPVTFALPPGVAMTIPGDSKGTIIHVTSADKEALGAACAKIRGFRPPEPYGGKGVRFQGEKVREKAGKAAKGGK